MLQGIKTENHPAHLRTIFYRRHSGRMPL